MLYFSKVRQFIQVLCVMLVFSLACFSYAGTVNFEKLGVNKDTPGATIDVQGPEFSDNTDTSKAGISLRGKSGVGTLLYGSIDSYRNVNRPTGVIRPGWNNNFTIESTTAWQYSAFSVLADPSDARSLDTKGEEVFKVTPRGSVFMTGMLRFESVDTHPSPTFPTNDLGKLSGYAKIFAKETGANTELRASDANHNQTTITPHNFALYEPDAADPLPWSYYSENPVIGKKINVNMSGAFRALEELTGKQFIFTEELAPENKISLDDLRAAKVLGKKEEKARKSPWIEVDKSDAVEQYEEENITKSQQNITKYRLNPKTGEVDSYQVNETIETASTNGVMNYRLKNGFRFDETTGKFYRPCSINDVSLDTAVIDEANSIELPQYVLDRLPN